jgi:hypothetical protein
MKLDAFREAAREADEEAPPELEWPDKPLDKVIATEQLRKLSGVLGILPEALAGYLVDAGVTLAPAALADALVLNLRATSEDWSFQKTDEIERWWKALGKRSTVEVKPATPLDRMKWDEATTEEKLVYPGAPSACAFPEMPSFTFEFPRITTIWDEVPKLTGEPLIVVEGEGLAVEDVEALQRIVRSWALPVDETLHRLRRESILVAPSGDSYAFRELSRGADPSRPTRELVLITFQKLRPIKIEGSAAVGGAMLTGLPVETSEPPSMDSVREALAAGHPVLFGVDPGGEGDRSAVVTMSKAPDGTVSIHEARFIDDPPAKPRRSLWMPGLRAGKSRLLEMVATEATKLAGRAVTIAALEMDPGKVMPPLLARSRLTDAEREVADTRLMSELGLVEGLPKTITIGAGDEIKVITRDGKPSHYVITVGEDDRTRSGRGALYFKGRKPEDIGKPLDDTPSIDDIEIAPVSGHVDSAILFGRDGEPVVFALGPGGPTLDTLDMPEPPPARAGSIAKLERYEVPSLLRALETHGGLAHPGIAELLFDATRSVLVSFRSLDGAGAWVDVPGQTHRDRSRACVLQADLYKVELVPCPLGDHAAITHLDAPLCPNCHGVGSLARALDVRSIEASRLARGLGVHSKPAGYDATPRWT